MTMTRSDHKEAYKFACVALWRAGDLLRQTVPSDIRRRATSARRQACRVISAVGSTDAQLADALRRYTGDLVDFTEDFPLGYG